MKNEYKGFFSEGFLGVFLRFGYSASSWLSREKLVIEPDRLLLYSQTFSAREEQIISKADVVSIGKGWMGSVKILHLNKNIPSPFFFDSSAILGNPKIIELLKNLGYKTV
jgi:hypothetical protein